MNRLDDQDGQLLVLLGVILGISANELLPEYSDVRLIGLAIAFVVFVVGAWVTTRR